MQSIETPHSRRAGNKAHYVPGMVHDGLLYISGQLSLCPESGSVPEGGIAAETRQALQNLDAVLSAAGVTRERVIQCRVYTPRMEDWDAINAVYAEFFGAHKPARVVVPTTALHYGCRVEIEAIAAMPEE